MALVVVSATAGAHEPKIILNGKQLAKFSVYSTPNNSTRYVKTITRRDHNTCLAGYSSAQRRLSKYINYCACRLEYGDSKCRL